MATIFAGQSAAFDGSSSPSVGSADVNVAYTCSPENGGRLELYARPNGSSIDYIRIWDTRFTAATIFRATGMQYYYVWTPDASNAVADLEG